MRPPVRPPARPPFESLEQGKGGWPAGSGRLRLPSQLRQVSLLPLLRCSPLSLSSWNRVEESRSRRRVASLASTAACVRSWSEGHVCTRQAASAFNQSGSSYGQAGRERGRSYGYVEGAAARSAVVTPLRSFPLAADWSAVTGHLHYFTQRSEGDVSTKILAHWPQAGGSLSTFIYASQRLRIKTIWLILDAIILYAYDGSERTPEIKDLWNY